MSVTVHVEGQPPLTIEVEDVETWAKTASFPEGSLAIWHRPNGTVHYRQHHRKGMEFVRQTIGVKVG